MKRLHIISLCVGLVLGLALHVSPARADQRPPSDVSLMQALNGEVSRDLNSASCTGWADGGGLTLWTADAGIGCNCVRTGAVYEMHCDVGVYFCPWGDGGCSVTIGSPNYGKPVKASTKDSPAPFYFVAKPDSTPGATKQVCMTQATTAGATCALYRLQ